MSAILHFLGVRAALRHDPGKLTIVKLYGLWYESLGVIYIGTVERANDPHFRLSSTIGTEKAYRAIY